MQYSLNKDLQHLKWQRLRSWVSSPDCLLRWTSSRRSFGVYPSENGRCSQIIENSKIGVSRHLDSSTTTQVTKIMVQYGRPSRSSWKEFVRSSFGRTIMGKAISENLIETWMGRKFQIGNVSLYIVRKVNFYLCMCMTSHWLERNKILIRCGKYSIKKSIWDNQRLSWIMYIWDALNVNAK